MLPLGLTVLLLQVLSLFFTTSKGERLEISGPSAIPVGNTVNFTCLKLMDIDDLIRWNVHYINGNGSEQTATGIVNNEQLKSFGATIVDSNNLDDVSNLVVNTTNDSIYKIECEIRDNNNQIYYSGIDTVIYHAPDPPKNLTYLVYGNYLETSWMFNKVHQIDVIFHLSLVFQMPSEIADENISILNVQSYNFSIEGLRSCNYFTFCVHGSNDAGLGNESCINGSVLYIPTEDNIDYSLSRDGENFTLTVEVNVRGTNLVIVQNSNYILEVVEEQSESKMLSGSIPADSTSYLQISDLTANSSYKFRIESRNCVKRGLSVWIDFITSDVEDISICSVNEKEYFNLSCGQVEILLPYINVELLPYINGSNSTGCGFRLTGVNAMKFEHMIMKDNSDVQRIPDIMMYKNIIITDFYGVEVIQKPFTSSVDVLDCSLSTDSSNNLSTVTINTATTHSQISTAAIIAIVLVPTLLLLLISILVVICLCWHGYCFHQRNPKQYNLPINEEAINKSSAEIEINGKKRDPISDNTQDTDVDIAATYSSLERLHTPHGADTVKKVPEAEYSQLKQEPLYHVLEKEPSQMNEDISTDPDAPAIPPFCPSGGDTPPVSEVQQTTSSDADFMYAEIGNVRAKK